MDKFTTTRKTVKISEVVPNSWNPNKQDEKTFSAEVASINKRGFIDPILVREIGGVYQIIDGEHRWKACKELNYTEILIESLGEISDIDAKTLTIDMNNLRGEDNVLDRAKLLKEIRSGQGLLFAISKEAIDEEIKLLDFDFSQFADTEVTETEKSELTQILSSVIKLEKLLRAYHKSTNNTKLKVLIEQFFEFSKLIIQKLES